MIKIKILSVGKTKEAWLEAALNEYVKRLSAEVQLNFINYKSDDQLKIHAEKEEGLICLDPAGLLLNSEQFSRFILQQTELNGARLTLVIGGAEGLPATLKTKGELISLSPLTFTHQLTRLVLAEQLYRAFEIAKGSKYHK